MESMVLPLELLQQFKSSDFPDQQEYMRWQTRNLKVLDAGLLRHPYLPLDKSDAASQRLRQILREASETPIETRKNSEAMQVLRNAAMSLAYRSFNGFGSDTCHWADGFPLNLYLYQMLLEACFNNSSEEASIIDEIDEVLELIKKTWVFLGINEMFHNLCFAWILFHRFVTTGQVDIDLLIAADKQLTEVAKDAKATQDPTYSKFLKSILSSIMSWTEKRLLAYHDMFSSNNIESMQIIVSLGVTGAKIPVEDISNEYRRRRRKEETDVAHSRIDAYIRSSLRTAFAQQFISSVTELTPDVVQVLRAADKLEKQLVNIAVEDSVDSDDGGKSLIREMPPYEAESAIANLVWIPTATKESCAPSSVEVLRIIDETLDAYFRLPIPMHPALFPDLLIGLDQNLRHYASKAKAGCGRFHQFMCWIVNSTTNHSSFSGSRNNFMPALPALTRCEVGSKLWKKKDKSQNLTKRRSQVGSTKGDGSLGLSHLCVRINSLYHIRKELENLEKKIKTCLRNTETAQADVLNGMRTSFELSLAACQEGILQLCETIAYKVVFHDLSHILWDTLYAGEPAASRIHPFLKELDPTLEMVSSTVHNRVRYRVITALMKASFDGFLLVLLAGGPSRGFSRQDSHIIEDDFKSLKDLYLADGDGLPEELIEKAAREVNNVLPLFRTDTESLIERFKRMVVETNGTAAISKYPLPPNPGHWSPTEPNTVLHVLCHRNDDAATKFLKRTYNLPKKL
ncbi:hypothetical protein GW17_00037283 [Ensete ventricosum]|nr:hypothetical protein GW17_00037283 [Ensete ventricosum]RZS00235.1 hypothetical protein BHM03_00029908 [Ensete ventricosum]